MAKLNKNELKKRKTDRAENGAENYEPKEYKTPRKHCPECESDDFCNEDEADDYFRLYMHCNDCGLQWYEPADLANLRMKNNGYNPEEVKINQVKVLVDGIISVNKDGQIQTYGRSSCKTEEEYIREYFGKYGIIYKKQFYFQMT